MHTAIDIEQMRGRLLTVDEAKERLEPTEHLREIEFDTNGGNEVTFDYPDEWNAGLDKSTDGFQVTTATVTIDGTTIPLTKDAALEAASKVGIQKSHALNTPGSITAADVNWHYKNGAGNQNTMKLLAGRESGVAFTRGSISPFSNSALIDAAVRGIETKYGTSDVLVDYKFHNSLDKTNIRLVVPSHSRTIGSARAAVAGDDPWSVGLDISNSLTGASPLEFSGYLFAWWCTNGQTFNHVGTGKYRRKPSLSADDAYAWAQHAVDDVLGDLEFEFEAVEALTQINLEGELNETLGRLFEKFKVPTNLRPLIIANLVESDDLTAFGLLNAITASANGTDMSPGEVAALLAAGGEVVHSLSNRCVSCGSF